MIRAPSNEEELVSLVQAARSQGRTIRTVGAGHSFSPVCQCDDILISMEKLSGVDRVDTAGRTATVRAGTKINALGEAFLASGLALVNQGDVDVQTIGGAVSTGTHGTGWSLANMSASVRAIRLLCADGEVRTLTPDADRDVFDAASVAIGSLGIIVDVELGLVPAYRLHERNWVLHYADCESAFVYLQHDHRNLEFFWLPAFDKCVLKALDPTSEAFSPESEMDAPMGPPGTVERYLRPARTHWSHRIYPSKRTVLFNEMEYSVPASSGMECFAEIRDLMLERFGDVRLSVEYRTLAPDGAFLSQAFEQQSVCISIHELAELDCKRFFQAAETVFLSYGGRPHWGKMHFCDAGTLQERYPRWSDFLAVRRRFDPDGMFLNDHLRTLFGL